MWRFIVATFLGFMLYVCSYTYMDFIEHPTVTTLEDTHYSVSNIKLPAVGICSNNKLSLKRVRAFIDEIAPRFNKSKLWLFDQMIWLGKMYDFDLTGDDQRIELQDIFDELVADPNYDLPEMRSIYAKLGVSCDELLVSCMWMGADQNCSELFVRRYSEDQMCCVFNYNKPTWKQEEWVKPPKVIPDSYDSQDFNLINGLKVLVNNMPEDYFYSTLLFEGVSIKIFTSYIFPDSTFGGVSDVFSGMGVEVFVSFETNYINSTENLRAVPPVTRGCLFNDERVLTHLGVSATLSDCYLDCKVKAVHALCGCIPFTISFVGPWGYDVCTLVDLPCLNKYKEKLSTIYPEGAAPGELEHEKEDSLKCNCFPACERTSRLLTTNYAHLKLSNSSLERTHTYVHVFNSRDTVNFYKTDIVQYWYELLVDGSYCLTCGSDKKLKLWNPYRSLLLKTYGGHGNEVLDAAGSCDSSQIVSCSTDKSVIVWDVSTGTPLRRLRGHAAGVSCVSYNEESTIVVSGGRDNTVLIWDLKSRKNEPIQILNDAKDCINAVRVSDHEILTGSVDCSVRRYDIRNRRMEADFIGAPITSVCFTNDGQCLVVGSADNTVRLMDKNSGEMLAEYLGHKTDDLNIESGIMANDSNVISGSVSGELWVWDLVSGKVLKRYEHTFRKALHSLCVHPKKDVLLTASVNTIKLWGSPTCIQKVDEEDNT